MAVFLAASDETDGGHHRSKFWHCGWLMPETDWYSYFAPAWQERVLDAEPKIPFLHMTDIRSPEWLIEHGLTWDQAQDKMNTAAILINQMGSLCPVTLGTDAGAFLDAHGKKKIMENVAGNKAARFLVDHYCFIAYVYGVVGYVHNTYPEAEKVDFVIEYKKGVSEKIEQFYDTLDKSFTFLGHPELVKYMGELTAVSKQRAPVQAADMLCWHISRADLDLLKGPDANRTATIFQGKEGPILELPDKLHFELARKFAEKSSELEKHNENKNKSRIRQLRPDDARSNERAARSDKSRSGQRKRGKGKKKAEG